MEPAYPPLVRDAVHGWSCGDRSEDQMTCPFDDDVPLSPETFTSELANARRAWRTPINAGAQCVLSCEMFGSSIDIGHDGLRRLTME
jgi:hypothetical protein